MDSTNISFSLLLCCGWCFIYFLSHWLCSCSSTGSSPLYSQNRRSYRVMKVKWKTWQDWATISTTTDQQLQRQWCPPETHVCLDLELCIKAKLFSAGGCLKLNYRRFFCHLPFKSDITECDHIYVENKQSKQFIHHSIHLPTHPSSTHPSNQPTHSSIHPPLQCSS